MNGAGYTSAMLEDRHPTQEELIEGAIRTIEEIFLPEMQTSWARASAIQLVGLLRYTLARQASDLGERQDAELLDCLRGLPPNAVTSVLTHRPAREAMLAAAGELLARSVGAGDGLALAVRTELRPLLTRHTAEDLAEAGPLLQGFMAGFRGVRADAE